jgi:hypothetical protein
MQQIQPCIIHMQTDKHSLDNEMIMLHRCTQESSQAHSTIAASTSQGDMPVHKATKATFQPPNERVGTSLPAACRHCTSHLPEMTELEVMEQKLNVPPCP